MILCFWLTVDFVHIIFDRPQAYSVSCALISYKMLQVLQKSVDQHLYLYSNMKEQSSIVAQLMVMSLTSQPVSDDIGTCLLSLPGPLFCWNLVDAVLSQYVVMCTCLCWSSSVSWGTFGSQCRTVSMCCHLMSQFVYMPYWAWQTQMDRLQTSGCMVMLFQIKCILVLRWNGYSNVIVTKKLAKFDIFMYMWFITLSLCLCYL